jgi:hypothetical protein
MKPSLWNRRGSASAQFPAAAAAVSPGPRRPNSASSREAIPVRRASRGSVAVELQASPSQVPGRDCDSSWPVSLTAAAPAADECRPWWMVLTAHHGVGLIWLACRHDARGDGPLCRRAAGRRSGLPHEHRRLAVAVVSRAGVGARERHQLGSGDAGRPCLIGTTPAIATAYKNGFSPAPCGVPMCEWMSSRCCLPDGLAGAPTHWHARRGSSPVRRQGDRAAGSAIALDDPAPRRKGIAVVRTVGETCSGEGGELKPRLRPHARRSSARAAVDAASLRAIARRTRRPLRVAPGPIADDARRARTSSSRRSHGMRRIGTEPLLAMLPTRPHRRCLRSCGRCPPPGRQAAPCAEPAPSSEAHRDGMAPHGSLSGDKL